MASPYRRAVGSELLGKRESFLFFFFFSSLSITLSLSLCLIPHRLSSFFFPFSECAPVGNSIPMSNMTAPGGHKRHEDGRVHVRGDVKKVRGVKLR